MQQSNWVDTVAPEVKVAIIIPIYGYWIDNKEQELTAETLQVSLLRLSSQKHKAYYVFVGENERVIPEVKNVLAGRAAGGNVLTVNVPPFTPYSEYISEGISVALEETDSSFIVVANPWLLVRSNAIDDMLERLNKTDADVVSGYDLRTHEDNGKVGIPAAEFDKHVFNPPQEFYDFNFNFWGVRKQVAQMLNIDQEMRTHYFFSRDLWQHCSSKGMNVISSQFFPVYSFDLNWKNIEDREDFDEDAKRFSEKWKFDSGIKYV